MRQINIQLSNRAIYTLAAMMVVVLVGAGFLIVNAYGGSSPAVVGHSVLEMDWGGTIPAINVNSIKLGSAAAVTTWPAGPTGPQGPAGATGPQGPAGNTKYYITNRHGNGGGCSNWCSTLGLSCISGHNAGAWGSAVVGCGSWAPVCVCQ